MFWYLTKPSDTWMYDCQWSSWILFHCLSSTCCSNMLTAICIFFNAVPLLVWTFSCKSLRFCCQVSYVLSVLCVLCVCFRSNAEDTHRLPFSLVESQTTIPLYSWKCLFRLCLITFLPQFSGVKKASVDVVQTVISSLVPLIGFTQSCVKVIYSACTPVVPAHQQVIIIITWQFESEWLDCQRHFSCLFISPLNRLSLFLPLTPLKQSRCHKVFNLSRY